MIMNYYPAAKIINDTNTHTGRFGCIKPLQDSVINTIQGPNILGDTTSINLKNQTFIEGVITSIKLDSGTVIAYRL